MSVAILIIGAVLIVAGLVAIFTAPKPKAPQVRSEGAGKEIAEALEQLNKLLDKFDKRLRLGVLLVLLGSGLVGLAGFVEAKDAKDDAKEASRTTAPLIARAR